MRPWTPNNHFPRVGCIRRLATEQRLKLNSEKSFLFNIYKHCCILSVIYDKHARIALDSDDIPSIPNLQ